MTAFSAASDFETGRGLPRNKEGMVKNCLSLGRGVCGGRYSLLSLWKRGPLRGVDWKAPLPPFRV